MAGFLLLISTSFSVSDGLAIPRSAERSMCILSAVPVSRPARLADDPRLRRWWPTMGLSLAIIIIFFAGAWAIIIFSRRFRAYLHTEKSPPTPSEDVWAMHKPPKVDDE